MPTEDKGALPPRPSGPSPGDPVECQIRVAATPETVFPYFTDPSRMVRWKGENATLDPRPGGAYRVEIQGGHVARGEYVELDPPRRVVFTWGWEAEDTLVKPGTSTVEVELIPEGEGTLVRLVHRDLPEEARDSHAMGWRHYLDRLAVVGGGGDPGPDPGPGSDS